MKSAAATIFFFFFFFFFKRRRTAFVSGKHEQFLPRDAAAISTRNAHRIRIPESILALKFAFILATLKQVEVRISIRTTESAFATPSPFEDFSGFALCGEPGDNSSVRADIFEILRQLPLSCAIFKRGFLNFFFLNLFRQNSTIGFR